MSKRVYLSKNSCQTTQEEDTPVHSRRQLSRSTVTDLHGRLQHADYRDDVRLVRRRTVVSDLLVHQVPVAGWCARWGLSPAWLSAWPQAFLLRGMASLVSHHGGGRRPQWTPTQKKRWVALLAAGPLVVGCETACWHAVWLRVLSWRECGVLSKRQDGCTLLPHLGCSFQQARCVSDHRDTARRHAGLQEDWPQLLRAAKRRKGLILCAEEASCAQWGSLSDPWARRGHQPAVPTSGKRKGYQVFGAMASFSGRLFDKGIEGRVPSASSPAFMPLVLAQTTAPLVLLHDGARYHTSQATQELFAAPADRLTVHPFPSSSPDDTPIESLWKKTQQRATHHKYCKECIALMVSVDEALAYCATHPDTVFGVCGRYCQESGLELKQAA
jgi:transposase